MNEYYFLPFLFHIKFQFYNFAFSDPVSVDNFATGNTCFTPELNIFFYLITCLPHGYDMSWSYIIEQYTSTIKLWVWHIKHLTALLNEKYRLPVGDIVWETGRAGFPLSFSWESDIHTQFWKTRKGCHLLKGSHSYWISIKSISPHEKQKFVQLSFNILYKMSTYYEKFEECSCNSKWITIANITGAVVGPLALNLFLYFVALQDHQRLN